jgi:four helix bundle protein
MAMSATFENLRILQIAEAIADAIWKHVTQWDEFARDVVGKQIARAADSVGANIAESFGRFNFGEKLHYQLLIANSQVSIKEPS